MPIVTRCPECFATYKLADTSVQPPDEADEDARPRKARWAWIAGASAALLVVLAGVLFSRLGSHRLPITSNPDSLRVPGQAYRVTDAKLAATGFSSPRNGGEPQGESPRREYQRLSDFIAIVVEWRVDGGAVLHPQDLTATLRGVSRVPNRFRGFLTDGKYANVGFASDLTMSYEKLSPTGEQLEFGVANSGAFRLPWFVPKDTRSIELVLGSHAPVHFRVPTVE